MLRLRYPLKLLGLRHASIRNGAVSTVSLVLALTGCSVHYDILLNNGATVTAYSKPKHDGHGHLIFNNEAGETVSINELRVVEVRAK